MYDKILLKLKQQREKTSNVSDRSLEDLAKSLENIITTDELLAASDLTAAIKSIDGNINHYTSETIKKLQKEADEKKALEEAEKLKKKLTIPPSNPPTEPPKKDDMPEWAKALIEQNNKLAEGLTALKTDKVTQSRSEKLKISLKDLPGYYTKPILSSFQNTSFKDDEAFDNYIKDIKSNNETFIQEAKEQGLNMTIPSKDIKKPEDNGETPALADAFALLDKEAEKQQKKE